jgi:hypothetical protein
VVEIPSVEVKLLLVQSGQPLAGEKCRVHDLDPPNEFTTDGDGVLTLNLPITTKEVTVEIERLSVTRAFRVGHLDPLTEPSGVRQRLQNLGHVSSADADLRDPALLMLAVRRFQRDQGMAVSGDLDGATLDAIARSHGC